MIAQPGASLTKGMVPSLRARRRRADECQPGKGLFPTTRRSGGRGQVLAGHLSDDLDLWLTCVTDASTHSDSTSAGSANRPRAPMASRTKMPTN